MREFRDIVPRDATEDEIREVYGDDADHVIAFRRFLDIAGPSRARGEKILLPQHWYDYATGKIGSREVLARDGAE